VGIISAVLLVAGKLCAQGENPAPDKPAEAPAVKPADTPAPVVETPAAVAPVAAAPAPVVEAAAVPVADVPAAAAPAAVPAVAAPIPVAEAPATTPVATNAVDNTRAALVSELQTLEGLRRNALRDYGMTSLAAGRKALHDSDYEEARKQYTMADTYIPDNPETRAARDEAKAGIRQALYLNAQLMWKKGDREKALQLARQASEKGHPDAAKLAADIQKEIENPPKVVPPKEMSRMLEASYKDDRDNVLRHLRVARQYYIVDDYDRSRQELELILRDHPYNTEAIEMLKKLGDRTYDISNEEFESTRSRMIRDVKASWTPRRYAIDTVDIKEPASSQSTSRALLPGGFTVEQAVEAKMRHIIIPEIGFRSANITDVIDFFQASSREYDDPSLPPEKRGVNFVLRGITTTASAAAAPTSTDPFAVPDTTTSAAGGSSAITFSARFVSLWDALKIVTEVANFKYQIRGNVVMVMPLNVTVDTMETRSYTVMPNVIERATGVARDLHATTGGAAAGPTGGGDTMSTETIGPAQDLKKLFTDLGVPWPVGSSISYLSIIGKLRVVNTTDNLATFEKVLEEMNVTPRQIEIEARFVEVSQNDLDELGVEWYQNQEITHNAPSGKATGAGSVILNPTIGAGTSTTAPYDMSQGLRFLDQSSGGPLGVLTTTPSDSLLSLQGVFGAFDVTAILHALSQRSNTDLLSAPKVVTKAGQEAVIKVVTEYIYPTTFTVQQSAGGGVNGGIGAAIPPSVEPGGFQTREVGVILQVVPEVSAEGQMINLTMNPQVVSEPDWHDYGYTVVLPNGNGSTAETKLVMQQPFFHVRSVSTSVSIYNGATVVMGGMITENRLSSDDKIPLLGDLPYFGQFFSSKAEQTIKRNLLIFVTARLVDPAGRSLKTQTEPVLSPKLVSEPKPESP